MFCKANRWRKQFWCDKSKKENELLPAIKLAFEHGTEVVLEENIEGRELTCGVFRNKEGIKHFSYRNHFRERVF